MKAIKSTILTILILVGTVLSLKSQDFWEQLYFPDSASILSIAVNDQQAIYIGSGAGVYRSDDDGINWTLVGLGNRIIYSVAINNNNDIYAGSCRDIFSEGLYRSSDNGETWIGILPDIGAYGNIVSLLCVGDTIFASLWWSDASLVRSTDNGQTWSRVFYLVNGNEYVSDIVRSNSGILYLGLTGYYGNMGGVYKSEDGGDNWQYIGLLNYQVSALALNTADDLFAGSWGGLSDTTSSGLYVLRNGEVEWETLLANPQVSDLIINSEDEIYFSSSWPNGVVRSLDNGDTFELINEGLPIGPMGDLAIDNLGFLYVSSEFSSNFLAKTIDPTVFISEKDNLESVNPFITYPNPANNILGIWSNKKNQIFNFEKIDIFSSNGKLLISEQYSSTDHCIISVNKLPAGLYFVEITGDKVKTVAKIIID
jgi:hypothetical protein